LSEVPFPWNEPPPEIPGKQAIEHLEREVAQLRKEVGALRAELLVLREERQNERAKPDVTQTISPFYSEAMQMAGHGADAVSISQNCGISRAEAELVLALVRNQDSR
jgi:phage shock protein A